MERNNVDPNEVKDGIQKPRKTHFDELRKYPEKVIDIELMPMKKARQQPAK